MSGGNQGKVKGSFLQTVMQQLRENADWKLGAAVITGLLLVLIVNLLR